MPSTLIAVAFASLGVFATACTPDGERAVGAEGFPSVPYMGGCCNGSAPAARDGDWGTFCDGGNGGGNGDCAPDGERNQGAVG